MKLHSWIMGLLVIESQAACAENPVFWRVLSSETNVVTAVEMNGTLAWSILLPGQLEHVQRSTDLSDPNGWQDYVQVPGMGATASVQVFDLNPPPNMVLIPAGRTRERFVDA